MQRSKVIAALIVAGAFVAGGGVGYAADHLAHAADRSCAPVDARVYWNRIGREWGLSTAQRRVIDSLMDAQRARIAALYRPLRPRLDSVAAEARAISDSTQAQLRLVLDPEQRVKLDRMRAEVRRIQAERRSRRDDELAKIR